MIALRLLIAGCLALNLAFTGVGLFDPWLDPQFNNIVDLEEPRFEGAFLAISVAKLVVAAIGACAFGFAAFGPFDRRPRLSLALPAVYALAEITLEVGCSIAANVMYKVAIAQLDASLPGVDRPVIHETWRIAPYALQFLVPLTLLALTAAFKWRLNRATPVGAPE